MAQAIQRYPSGVLSAPDAPLWRSAGEAALLVVCPACEAQIQWVESPLCTCCGQVFASRDGSDPVGGGAPGGPAPLRPGPGRSPLDGPVAQSITRFKFSRQLAFLPVMHHWLQRPYC